MQTHLQVTAVSQSTGTYQGRRSWLRQAGSPCDLAMVAVTVYLLSDAKTVLAEEVELATFLSFRSSI